MKVKKVMMMIIIIILNQSILLFSKDALNWSKVDVKKHF